MKEKWANLLMYTCVVFLLFILVGAIIIYPCRPVEQKNTVPKTESAIEKSASTYS